jgi:hypothetical protein
MKSHLPDPCNKQSSNSENSSQAHSASYSGAFFIRERLTNNSPSSPSTYVLRRKRVSYIPRTIAVTRDSHHILNLPASYSRVPRSKLINIPAWLDGEGCHSGFSSSVIDVDQPPTLGLVKLLVHIIGRSARIVD